MCSIGLFTNPVHETDITNYIVDKNRDYAQVLEERDGSSTVLVKYNYGDDLISQNRNNVVSYYHYDGQMSVRQLTDDTQNVTDGYTYDAFGILINRFGGTENNYMYTGEQYDPNIGFYYLRSRYMYPLIGRFLTMDIWEGSIYDPLSLNKYLYCASKPVNHIDPSGEEMLVDMAIGITITAILSTVVMAVFVDEKVRTTMASPEFAMTRAELELIFKEYAKHVSPAILSKLLNTIRVAGVVGALATIITVREDIRENGFSYEHAVILALVGIGLLNTELGLYGMVVYTEVCFFLKFVVRGLQEMELLYVRMWWP